KKRCPAWRGVARGGWSPRRAADRAATARRGQPPMIGRVAACAGTPAAAGAPGAYADLLNASQRFDRFAAIAIGRHEALDALTGEHLAGVDVAFRIGRDHVEAEELASPLAHASQPAGDLSIVAIQEPDGVVLDVADVEILLRLVRRERHAAGRAAIGIVALRARRRHRERLHELALARGDVDTFRRS